MDPVKIASTENSPEVDFDFEANAFRLSGMFFMEDTRGFFAPLMEALKAHMDDLGGAQVRFDFQLTYFNSSAARHILTLFDLLDATAERGNAVAVRWYHDDEDMAEQGEEFGEDLEHAGFEVLELA